MTTELQRWKECTELLYQNREQEAYEKLGEILPQINEYLQAKVQMVSQEETKLVLDQMQDFVEAYQCKDQLALADWLFVETLDMQDASNLVSNEEEKDQLEILKGNEQALQDVWGNEYKAYNAFKIENGKDYCLEETCFGEKIIGVVKNGHEYRLNSVYKPEWAARQYATRYQELQDYAVIGILGLSDGRAVRSFLQNCNTTQTVIIYEPDANVFCMAMQNFVLADILKRKNVFLVVEGLNGDELSRILEKQITYQNRGLLVQCILPNYDVLYPLEGNAFIDAMIYYIKMEVFNKNTEVLHAATLGDNLMYNLPYVLKQSSVYELKKYIMEKEYNDVPAIIVSAGPSLDKNIQELKNAEGKAFIIGVDSSLKALVREGIHIQIAVSVDPGKNPELFKDERMNAFPYVLSCFSLPLIVQQNHNRIFYKAGYGSKVFENLIYQKANKRLGELETGGSVATDAFSLALELGFKKIILVGQDLAFTGGKGHVSGFVESAANKRTEDMLVDVESINGEIIKTDLQMAYYREWFEKQIEKMKGEVIVINATEGGARIHGAVETTLHEAIETYCTKHANFDKVISEVPNLLSDAEQKILLEEFLQTENRLLDLERKILDGINVYEQLITLEEKNQQNTQEYRVLIEKIAEVNALEETEDYMNLARLYAKQMEYEAAEDIYTAEELSVSDIAIRGKKLLEGYLEGSRICREHVRDILIPQLSM